jgi:hypothetical protein
LQRTDLKGLGQQVRPGKTPKANTTLKEIKKMNKRMMLCFLVSGFTACYSTVLAQAQTQSQGIASTQPQIEKESEKINIQAYIELLRTNVRQEKSQIMGDVMCLSVD